MQKNLIPFSQRTHILGGNNSRENMSINDISSTIGDTIRRRSSIEVAGILGITQRNKYKESPKLIQNMNMMGEEVKYNTRLPRKSTVLYVPSPNRDTSFCNLANAFQHRGEGQNEELSSKALDASEISQVNIIEDQIQINSRRLSSQNKMPSIVRTKWLRIFRKLLIINRVLTSFIELIADIQKYGGSGKKNERLDNTTCTAFIRLAGPQHKRRHVTKKTSCIILPDSKGAWIWTMSIIILLIWTALYLPYRLAFLDEISLPWLILETIIDSLFFIDIIVNFLTAYYENDNEKSLVTDHCKIAKKYLKTWFIIDFISCIPIQLIESDQKYSKALRLLRLPRLYKLLKFMRVVKVLNFFNVDQIYEKFFILLKLNSGVGRLLKVLVTMGFFIHLYACFWFLLAKLRDFPPDCWVVQLGLLDASNAQKYIVCYYWVLQTLTTVGYGDMPITGMSERISAIILMIFGVGFYSYTIGNLSSIFANIDARKTRLNAKILALNEFAFSIKMAPKLYLKIVHALTNNSSKGDSSFFKQDILLDELPSALRNEVLGATHQKILNSFSFFKDKPPQFVIDCLPKFKHLTLSQDEALYREGDYVEDVYFLLQGRVAFVTNDGFLFRNFVQGSYFGEIELFKNKEVRSMSALTMTDVELLVIKKRDLENLLNHYPRIKEEMSAIAHQRAEKNEGAQKVARQADFKIEPQQISLVCGSPGGYNIHNTFFKENKEVVSIIEESGESDADSFSSNSSESDFDELPPIIEEEKEELGMGSMDSLGSENDIKINKKYNKNIYTEDSGHRLSTKKKEFQESKNEVPLRKYDFMNILHPNPCFVPASRPSILNRLNERNINNYKENDGAKTMDQVQLGEFQKLDKNLFSDNFISSSISQLTPFYDKILLSQDLSTRIEEKGRIQSQRTRKNDKFDLLLRKEKLKANLREKSFEESSQFRRYNNNSNQMNIQLEYIMNGLNNLQEKIHFLDRKRTSTRDIQPRLHNLKW